MHKEILLKSMIYKKFIKNNKEVVEQIKSD